MMPASNTPSFDQFIRRAHFRYVILRSFERAGLGALAGSVLGAVLLPLLWEQSNLLFWVASAGIILGGVTGLLWGVARRPAMLDTAMEADRQLQLSDLLSSALLLRNTSESLGQAAWQQTVLAMADARCRGLSPGEIVLHRLGARAWGGIGLATALVLTVGLLGSSPADSRAQTARPMAAIQGRTAVSPDDSIDRPLLPASVRRPGIIPERENESGGARLPAGSESVAAASPPAPPDSGTVHESTIAQPGGAGSGLGKTDVRVSDESVRSPSSESKPKSTPGLNGSAAAAGSGAASDDEPRSGKVSASAGTVTPGVANRDRSPPWTSDHWPADIRGADAAIQSGDVPPSYRGVVRKYFERN